MIRVLVVDDNTAFRRLLVGLIESRFRFFDLIDISDGAGCLEQVELIKPDLVIIDIRLADENGLELIKKIKQRHTSSYVVVLTQYDLAEYRHAAYNNGASFFLSKSASSDEILSVVDTVLRMKL